MTLEDDFGVINFSTDEGRSVDLLPEFLKSSTNLKNLILSIVPEVQEAYDAMKDVYITINIFTATGLQLDNIFGEILDLEREPGQTDTQYRADILAEASKKVRSGEISVVKSIFRSLMGATSVSLIEYQPAAFKLEAVVLAIPSASELLAIRSTMIEAKQGGNNMDLSAYMDPYFSLTSADNQLNDPNGLSSDSFDGGYLGEAL